MTERLDDQQRADKPCETCNDDPAVCSTVPGLRHCEKAMRPATPAENMEVLYARLNEHMSPAEKRELQEVIALLRTHSAAAPIVTLHAHTAKATQVEFNVDYIAQLRRDWANGEIGGGYRTIDGAEFEALCNLAIRSLGVAQSASVALDPDVHRVLEMLIGYGDDADARRINGHIDWIPLDDHDLAVLGRLMRSADSRRVPK